MGYNYAMPEKPEDLLKRGPEKSNGKPEQEAEQALSNISAAPDPVLAPERIQARALENEKAIQDTLDKLGTGARGAVGDAPKDEPRKFQAAEVKTKEDFRVAMDVMKTVFTDPTDLETNRTFCKFFFQPELARYYLMKDEEKPIGVQLLRVNPNVPDAMYTPYGGLTGDYRNLNLYPKMATATGEQMRERGVKYGLNDVEDPTRIRGVYPEENQEEVIERCKGRINFFKRSLGMHFVNDPDVPYCRPASDDTDKIQAYDLLGFRPLDTQDPLWKGVFNEDKTAITRESYEKLYLDLMQLEYGTKDGAPSKDELRKNYPAIDKFFSQMDAHPDKKWIKLDGQPIRGKETPDAGATVTLGDGGLDQRARWQHVPRNGIGWERPLQQPTGEKGPEQELKPVELTSMTEQDMRNVIAKIEKAFGTDTDPTQAAPSVEQFKGLQNVDPYSLLLRKDDKGEVIGWSGMVPVSKQLAEDFVQGKINEAQIISGAIEKPGYDALYHWAFYTDPEARQKGETINFAEAQFKKLIERHPTIQDHVAWGYSEEGAKFMHRMEQDLGIRIRKTPGSF